MQTSYNFEMAVGTKGQRADNGHYDILSKNNPVDRLYFGRGVAKVAGDEDGVQLPDAADNRFEGCVLRDMGEPNEYFEPLSSVPVVQRGRIFVEVEEAVTPDDDVYATFDGRAQVQTLTFDADFVEDNEIDMNINGTAITAVAFDTDHDTTLAALAVEIALSDAVESAEVTSAREITITSASHSTDIAITGLAVTGGLSQPGGAVAETISSILNTERGKFRTDADSPVRAFQVTNAKWFKGAAAGGLAILDLNL